jgi:hypothetical protein
MKKKTTLFVLLAFCAAVPLFLAQAGEKAAADTSAEIKNSIRHRCVLECVWANERSPGGPKGDAFVKKCGEGCMDKKAIEAVVKAEVSKDWGTTKQKAIEVCLPSGEHYFLQDLRCPDGKAPEYQRSGSVGSRNPMPEDMEFDMSLMDPTHRLKPGEIDYHIIDRYEVKCRKKTHVLFLDMYHCGTLKPWKAPQGFTRPPRG